MFWSISQLATNGYEGDFRSRKRRTSFDALDILRDRQNREDKECSKARQVLLSYFQLPRVIRGMHISVEIWSLDGGTPARLILEA